MFGRFAFRLASYTPKNISRGTVFVLRTMSGVPIAHDLQSRLVRELLDGFLALHDEAKNPTAAGPCKK
jgi:hypothetical protein